MSRIYLTERGAKLEKNGGYYVISRENEKIVQIPIETIEGITLINNTHMTSAVAMDCLQRNIPVNYLSSTRKYLGTMNSIKYVNILKEQEQFRVYEDMDFRMALAKRIIFGKIYNQSIILKRYNRNRNNKKVEEVIKQINYEAEHLHCTQNIEEIMGYEGHIAALYFGGLGQLVDEKFQFSKRSKQPPKDKFNVMLSFVYTLLFYEFYNALIEVGLNPYIGCIHALKNGHAALVSDLMEPWRPAVTDTLCLAMISRGEMRSDYFETEEINGGVYLNRIGRKVFLQKYEEKMKNTNKYFVNSYSWRHTIKLEAASYATCIMMKDGDKLKPMVIR